jgi:cell division septum initiation protein DivIVA
MTAQEQLDQIERKLRTLIERYGMMREENLKLKTRLAEQDQQLQSLRAEVDRLRTQLQIARMVKINTLNLDEPARKEIRSLLNDYIREIELCIAELQI